MFRHDERYGKEKRMDFRNTMDDKILTAVYEIPGVLFEALLAYQHHFWWPFEGTNERQTDQHDHGFPI